jgi:hypothetical protein
LQSLGVQFKTVTTLPASGVVVVGAGATINDAQLDSFARNGGKVLFMARQNTQGAAGLQLQEKANSSDRCRHQHGLKRAVCPLPTYAGAMPQKHGLCLPVMAGKSAPMACWHVASWEPV